MNKRLGQVISYAFMVAAVAFLVLAIARQWDEFTATLARMEWRFVALAASMGVVAVGGGVQSFRYSIAATAELIPLGPSAHAFLVSQLGKYVPGAVWAVVAQVQLMRQHGVSRARGALGSLISMVVALGTAVVVGAIGVFAAGGSIASFWWLIPVAVACALVLVPRALTWSLRRLAPVHRRFAGFVEVEINGRALVQSAFWCCVSWIFWGLQFWLLMRGLGYDGGRLVWLAIGSYALAWAVGRVVVFAPGGIGPREAALVAILSVFVPGGDALALAVITRVLMALLDILGAALAATVRSFRA